MIRHDLAGQAIQTYEVPTLRTTDEHQTLVAHYG